MTWAWYPEDLSAEDEPADRASIGVFRPKLWLKVAGCGRSRNQCHQTSAGIVREHGALAGVDR